MFEITPPRTQLLARALHHPARATLEKHLYAAAEPMPLVDLARILNLAIGAVRYHVRVLVACGLVELDREDRAHSR